MEDEGDDYLYEGSDDEEEIDRYDTTESRSRIF